MRRLEELAAELVDDFPWRLLDFIFCDWVKEVSCIGQAVGTEGTEFRELEVGTPDLCEPLVTRFHTSLS